MNEKHLKFSDDMTDIKVGINHPFLKFKEMKGIRFISSVKQSDKKFLKGSLTNKVLDEAIKN